MWLILLLTLLTIFYGWVRWKFTYWSRRDVSNPKPTFFFGNIYDLLTLKKDLGTLAVDWYSQYFNMRYIGIYKMLKPAVVIRDPELVEDILNKDQEYFGKNDFPFESKDGQLFTMSPVTAFGYTWRRGRNIMCLLFTMDQLRIIFSKIQSISEQFCVYTRMHLLGKDVDAKSLCSKFTTAIAYNCIFDIKSHSFRPENNESAERLLLDLKFIAVSYLPKWILRLIPHPFIPEETTAWFKNFVIEQLKTREKCPKKTQDFMQMLLDLEYVFEITKEEFIAYVMTLFLEMCGKPSTTLAFILYHLANNPTHQESVHKEIKEVLLKHNQKITYEALEEMTFLDCVIYESMRLSPIATCIQKTCTRKYSIPPFANQRKRVKIYPGMSVIVPVLAIHMDPVYYPDPEKFDPDRFTEQNRRERPKGQYLPFGEGARRCLGSKFALLQMKAVVAGIICDMRITVSPNHKPFQPHPTAIFNRPIGDILLNFNLR